ncbi:MAG: hypothetical protein NC122_04090 [Faecalibacterium sp.]|nr:hypothetical protein [Ruminococcus sp.]MCM1391720.1 hypothetical protein [Ruminococcus sp.]MCM1485367.1 hypothetical protein [Faecalibacterium sp.]
MTKRKAVKINNHIYADYIDGISSIDDFVSYLNNHYNSFVKLNCYVEADCVAPYFISDAVESQYFNVSIIRQVCEDEIFILPRDEYDAKLKEVVKNKCVHCIHYTEVKNEKYDSHRDQICLDGSCCGFEEKAD